MDNKRRPRTATAIRSISSSRTIGASCGLARLHLGTPDMRNVGDRAMPFPFQFPLAGFAASIQFIEMLLGLRNDAIETRHRLALDLAVEEVAELDLLAINQS